MQHNTEGEVLYSIPGRFCADQGIVPCFDFMMSSNTLNLYYVQDVFGVRVRSSFIFYI